MPPICIEPSIVQGIPILTFVPQSADRAPLVFFIHGFGGRKEDGIELGYRMAQAGIACVAVDAYLHGERLGEPLDDLDGPHRTYTYPLGTGFDTWFVMLECALRTARDLDLLIDALASDPRMNTGSTGVTGFSMGGFATYFAAANSPRIRTVVPMGAFPDLPRRWNDLILEAASYPEWTAAMEGLARENERRMAWLREIDPCARMIAGYRSPLLILHGDADIDAPKAYSVPFYGALRPFYQAQPEQLRLKIFDGVAHQLTGAMMQDAVDWFSAHLKAGKQP